MARHRAEDPDRRIGVLLVNPEDRAHPACRSPTRRCAVRSRGPRSLRHRRLGPPRCRSVAPSIDCITERERYFSIELSPDTPEEEEIVRDTAAALATGCVRRTGALIDHVTSVDNARDMDAIRQALGEDEVSYLGLSYGSTLGATWATMFPDTVRACGSRVIEEFLLDTTTPEDLVCERGAR